MSSFSIRIDVPLQNSIVAWMSDPGQGYVNVYPVLVNVEATYELYGRTVYIHRRIVSVTNNNERIGSVVLADDYVAAYEGFTFNVDKKARTIEEAYLYAKESFDKRKFFLDDTEASWHKASYICANRAGYSHEMLYLAELL